MKRHRSYRLAAAVLLGINLVSAVAFIAAVDRAVFDDPPNLRDIERYARDGVSVDTIMRHVNPTGPGSFIWIATIGRALTTELWGFRLAVVLSWLVLGVFVCALDQRTARGELLCAGLMATVVFPHAASATGTLLTEGPALMFAVCGSVVWMGGLRRQSTDVAAASRLALGGLLAGISIVCRQYYLAILPAMAVLAVVTADPKRRSDLRWWVLVGSSLLLAATPILALYCLWGGLSSPGMTSGDSYDSWRSGVGLSPLRPVIALLYTGIALTPFCFPAFFMLSRKDRLASSAIACLVGILTACWGRDLLQWGPILSIVSAAERIEYGGQSMLFLVSALATSSLVNLVMLLGRLNRSGNDKAIYIDFSLLVICFFVLEQIGVGGNIQFYERYMIQVAPFIGMISFGLVRGCDRGRFTVILIMAVASNLLLWRHA